MGEEKILYYTPEQAKVEGAFKDAKSGEVYEIILKELFVDWLAEHYRKFGCSLQFVTDRSSEGAQFVKGFGGIGGLLRYTIDFTNIENEDAASGDDYDFIY